MPSLGDIILQTYAVVIEMHVIRHDVRINSCWGAGRINPDIYVINACHVTGCHASHVLLVILLVSSWQSGLAYHYVSLCTCFWNATNRYSYFIMFLLHSLQHIFHRLLFSVRVWFHYDQCVHLSLAAISHTTFWNAFWLIKSVVCWFELHWSLFIRVQLTISRHWFR